MAARESILLFDSGLGGLTVYREVAAARPHVDFVFTCGSGVQMAALEPDANRFRMTRTAVRIPSETREFAINASNSRHWPGPVRAYIEDCLEGEEGPRGRNFNMRWTGAAVAEAYRILVRGGIAVIGISSRLSADDSVQDGPDLVAGALPDLVASLAFAEDLLAGGGVLSGGGADRGGRRGHTQQDDHDMLHRMLLRRAARARSPKR